MYYTCASILMSNFYIKRQLIPWRTIIICSVAGFPLLASLAAKSNIEIKKALIVLWRLNENNILKWMDTYIGCTLTLETLSLSLDKHCYFDSRVLTPQIKPKKWLHWKKTQLLLKTKSIKSLKKSIHCKNH